MFGHQCGNCGRLVGKWVKRARVKVDPKELPEWDYEIGKVFEEKARELWREERVSRLERDGVAAFAKEPRDEDGFWSHYTEYLQSDAWHYKRGLVLKRAGGVCEGCGVADATQVHHLTYDRVGREMLFDLVAICNDCHEALHGKTQ